ncbi:MAG: hypothetical protein K2Y08_07960 [Alphaproteobacteria bacterium]|nr:hypothetical protein [Silvanigrellaceae bacterium]MBX9787255.1 hypothetical protein [Alphaproteobacteria bacterium]
MDILTKVKKDHDNIHVLLQQIITKAKEGNKINILVEDFLEEVKEHMEAEKACIAEMLMEEKKLPFQINKEILSKALSEKLYQDFGKVYENKELESKLYALDKLLQEHSHYTEDIISLLSQECISDQKSEELGARFEQEKVKTLINSITYA